MEPQPKDDAVIAAAEAEKPEDDDPELELLVYENVIRRKRSGLIEAYDLEAFDNGRIINIAQKQMAADQRPAKASRLQTSSVLGRHPKRRR